MAGTARSSWPRRLDLRRAVMHDFPLKAAAVLIAILFWLANSQSAAPREVTIAFDGRLPVERPDVPPGYVLRGNLGDVGVKLSGPEGVVDRLALADLRATLDIVGFESRAEPRDARVVVTATNPAVKVVDITPPTVSVRIERITSRSVAVQPRLANEPPKGSVAGQTSVAPTEVRVSGPESAVSQIAAVYATVRFGDVSTDLTQSAPAVPVDERGIPIDGLQVEPGVVVVTVPLLPASTTRTVPVLWNLRGSVAPGYWISRVTTDPIVVTVRGDQQVIAGLERIETAPVDVSGLTSTRTIRAALVLPEGATLVEPITASVTVNVVPLAGTRPFYTAVQILNVGATVTAEAEPGSVTILVAGPQAALAGLAADQVIATVDAAGRGPGSYPVDVSVRLPAGFTVQSVQPVRIALTIRSRS